MEKPWDKLVAYLQRFTFPENWNPLTAMKPQVSSADPATTANDQRPKETKPGMAADAQCLTPEGGPISARLYDSCAYVIVCPRHSQIAVSCQPETGFAWLPFTPLPSNRSWNEGALYGSFIVLAGGNAKLFVALQNNLPYTQAHLIDVLRMQMPHRIDFLTRLVYFIQLNPNTSNEAFACCQNTSRIRWFSLAALYSCTIDHIWGSELFQFGRWYIEPTNQRVREYGQAKALFYVPHKTLRNLEEQMLKSALVTQKDVERLYLGFIDHCFPAFSMTIVSFKKYMVKYDLEKDDRLLLQLFRAFNYKQNGFLSFHELLLGLASIESNTGHCEARIKFVFRYYDRQYKGFLVEDDFRRMLRDLNSNLTEQELTSKVAEFAAAFKIEKIGHRFGITSDEFVRVVARQAFMDVSSLCRAKKAIFPLISSTVVSRQSKQSHSLVKDKELSSLIRKCHKDVCARCKQNKFSVVPFVTKVSTRGQVSLPLKGKKTKVKKCLIESYLLSDHPASQLLALIRKFNTSKGTAHQPNGLLTNEVPRLVSLFRQVHKEMLRLHDSSESKCFQVSSPCIVVGDIHGNIEDLLSMEKVIWPALPRGANLLFLGDYVDRGSWGVECALYVLSIKVLFPHKVTLLRGNHEVRSIQERYSFWSECEIKYKNQGRRIWDMFNEVFDRLPIAAVLDDAMFAVHGGLSNCELTIDHILRQPLDIRQPDVDKGLVWDILWSDPADKKRFDECCFLEDVNPSKSNGFVDNRKRSTGWVFSEVALDRFLLRNGLTHMVRAHEVPPHGFMFHFGDKCVTIFSCSHYDAQNKCAVMLVDQERARLIQVDTSQNLPATPSTATQ